MSRTFEIQGAPPPDGPAKRDSEVPVSSGQSAYSPEETQARPQPGAGIRVGPLCHRRALTGNDLSVAVSAAEQGPALEAILILYDGSALFRDRFAPPMREWSRHWARVGQATPGMRHKLAVSVWDAVGNEHRGLEEWDDQ
ncbi:MAG: hypothetical protein ACRD24_01035 [Terriglobales bacterium]